MTLKVRGQQPAVALEMVSTFRQMLTAKEESALPENFGDLQVFGAVRRFPPTGQMRDAGVAGLGTGSLPSRRHTGLHRGKRLAFDQPRVGLRGRISEMVGGDTFSVTGVIDGK